MLRLPLATTALIALTLGLAGAASAATQEYQFTVPVSVKIAPKSVKGEATSKVGDVSGTGGSGLPVTVTCG